MPGGGRHSFLDCILLQPPLVTTITARLEGREEVVGQARVAAPFQWFLRPPPPVELKQKKALNNTHASADLGCFHRRC